MLIEFVTVSVELCDKMGEDLLNFLLIIGFLIMPTAVVLCQRCSNLGDAWIRLTDMVRFALFLVLLLNASDHIRLGPRTQRKHNIVAQHDSKTLPGVILLFLQWPRLHT